MIIAGLWRYGDWRHVAKGCNALVRLNVNKVLKGYGSVDELAMLALTNRVVRGSIFFDPAQPNLQVEPSSANPCQHWRQVQQ